jgi:hypothetical protein
MKPFMNGAEVSLNDEQNGAIFRQHFKSCISLIMGGRPDENIYYRGKIDEFGL